MKFSIFTIATLCAIGTQATWCRFYYDSNCQQDSGGTAFDCANPGSFGDGGSYVQCGSTSHNHQDCIISRCTSSNCADILNKVTVSPGDSYSPCTYTGGPGPWYEETFA